jgi:hypothetical protein
MTTSNATQTVSIGLRRVAAFNLTDGATDMTGEPVTDKPTTIDDLRLALAEMGHHPESDTAEYRLFDAFLGGQADHDRTVCRAPTGHGCVCRWLVADALQKYLCLDHDLSAKIAADLWAQYRDG